MTVVDNQIWLFQQVLTDPESSDLILVNLLDTDWRGQVSMAEHAESEERVCHFFREEDTVYPGRYIGERISHTSDDNVLEDGGALDER